MTQCGHSFCQKCLSSYESESNWKCPKSQIEQTVPVKSLPRNYAIEKIVATVNDFDLCEIHERPKEIRKLHLYIEALISMNFEASYYHRLYLVSSMLATKSVGDILAI